MKSTQGPIDSWRTETFTTETLGRGNPLWCNQQVSHEYKTSSHTKPRPGRRRHSVYQLSFSSALTFLFTLLILSLLCVPTEAASRQRPGTWKVRGKVIERIEDLSFDLEAKPELRLHRRQTASTKPEASTIPAPTSNNGASNTDVTPTSSVPATSILSAAPSNTNSPLPKPFDGGIGTNFTQPSCPTFLNAMINNETFTSCLPFSLLLQNSVSFFSATKTLESITTVLNASCSVIFPLCSSLMSTYATQLRSSSACAQDYDRENPLIRQAYAGLLSYDILYHASCLKNTPNNSPDAPGQDNSNYCFANAITNETNPTDSYVYYLPLGISLPAGSLPTCDGCLKDTMALFAQDAENKSQPLSLDYLAAAELINQDCGPDYVNATIPTASGGSTSGATTAIARPGLSIVGTVVLAVWALLWSRVTFS